jgi:hypothetical protein
MKTLSHDEINQRSRAAKQQWPGDQQAQDKFIYEGVVTPVKEKDMGNATRPAPAKNKAGNPYPGGHKGTPAPKKQEGTVTTSKGS